METDAPFARPTRVVVTNAPGRKELQGAVVHADRDVDLYGLLRLGQTPANVLRDVKLVKNPVQVTVVTEALVVGMTHGCDSLSNPKKCFAMSYDSASRCKWVVRSSVTC